MNCEQINKIAYIGEILTELGLKWWVNSGTLLGFVREGRILPWDNDVDLSCWADEIDWDHFRHRIDQEGWELSLKSWGRVVYAYKMLVPGLPDVNLQVVRRADNVAWVPVQKKTQPFPYPEKTFRWHIYARLRGRLKTLSRFRHQVPFIEGLCSKFDLTYDTWITPASYFLHLEYFSVGEESFPVPNSTEDFLTLRYGAWQHPVPSWDFRRDDATYSTRDPISFLSTATPPLL